MVTLKGKTREKLEEKYGRYGLDYILTVCPYALALCQDADFNEIDTLVLSDTGIDPLCPARMANALLYTLRAVESGTGRAEDETEFGKLTYAASGSTCIPKSAMYVFLEELLGLEEGTITMPMLDRVVKHLAITGKISVNRVGDRIMLANKDTFTAEKQAAEKIKELLGKDGIVGPRPKDRQKMYKAADEAMAITGQLLSQEQKNGVCMILQNRISVLTGGPGTGKSATQNVLIQTLKILKPNCTVRCIAPTGQAANRMQEATGFPSSTIHSALRMMPGETKSKVVLSEDLILVDESSMIDTFMFAGLLDSISDHSSIVFIGDTAQLPSISAGNVLDELIRSSVPVTQLTKVFRQGDNSIAFNCSKIKMGNPNLDEDKSFQFIECGSSEEISKEVCRLYAAEVAENGIDSVCCLTPYRRKTKTGVNQLNPAIRKRLNGPEKRTYCEYEGSRIYTGDKITFLRNKNGLVNGETGTAIKAFGDSCTCQFGDTTLTFTGEELSWLEPAYAQTVHKAQGQEYKTCIIVCDEKHSSFLSRNLIYTSISRAKKKCVCIGSKKAMQDAILTEKAQVRTSSLAALIG